MFCGGGSCTADHRDGPTVLIVEDERISLRALAFLLDASGYQPQPCQSAEEALAQVDHGSQPDFALVDIDLPGMNGLDLIQQLERLRPGTIAILMTAYEGERVNKFGQDHRVHYLRKPLDFPRLLGLLEARAGGKSLPC